MTGHQLSPFQFRCVPLIADGVLAHAGREPLSAVRVLALVLTYILPSTISTVEICVNQPPLWPARPLPPSG